MLVLVGAIFGQARYLAVLGGVLAIIVAALFAFQTTDLMNDLDIEEAIFDALGVGPFVAFFGGSVAIVAGLTPRTD